MKRKIIRRQKHWETGIPPGPTSEWFVFRCVQAALEEGVSVGLSVGPSVGRSV